VEPWKQFKIGDVLRMVKVPDSVLSMKQERGPDGILRVYQRAIARKSRLVVYEFDFGFPWVQYTFKNKRNKWEYHSMCVDDDSYVKVDEVRLPPGS